MITTDNGYEQLLSRFTADEFPPLIIAIGLGDGGLLEAVERRSTRTRVLAIEPVEATASAFLSRDTWRPWLDAGRLTLLVGPHYEGRSDAWRLIDRRSLKPPMLVAPSLEEQFPEETAGAKAVARQIVLGAQSNDEARRRFSGPYLLNTLSNLSTIASEGDASKLAGIFAGLPAIVVGAGPSLDANLPALKKVADRAVIIAVDTAVRPLLAAGIHPQLVVGVDPSDDNAEHIRGIPDPRGIWFVAEPSLTPDVFWQFRGRTFLYKVSNHHPWPWLNSFGLDCGRLQAWGSVITTAFDLACHAGCSPVVFAGADLAYTNGLPYCRNTVYEPEWSHLTTVSERAEAFKDRLAAKGTTEAQDTSGRDVLTAPRFIQFRDWIVARSQKETARRIVNATGGGILHGGRIEQIGLGALHLPKPTVSPADLQERLHKAWHGAKDPVERSASAVTAVGSQNYQAVASWLTECGETASPEQVVASLTAARLSVDKLAAEMAYTASQRDYYDSQIKSAEDARRLSHGSYDSARRHSPHRQAHILLEHLQRTYQLTGPAKTATVVDAMSRIPRVMRALDIGCGAGRGMEPMAEAGIHVDGVDVSAAMIKFAQKNPALKNSTFFLSNGWDCGDAPDAAYDLVYSNICFQFICARSIRQELLRSMARALRKGGVAVIHFRFHPDSDSANVPIPWTADDVVGHPRGLEGEVCPTPDALFHIYWDMSRFFSDVRLQVVDFEGTATHPRFAQLMVSGCTDYGLAARLSPKVS